MLDKVSARGKSSIPFKKKLLVGEASPHRNNQNDKVDKVTAHPVGFPLNAIASMNETFSITVDSPSSDCPAVVSYIDVDSDMK